MKKLLTLLLTICSTFACFTACDIPIASSNDSQSGSSSCEHTYIWVMIIGEGGHQMVYTCGCPSPDIIEPHTDSNNDNDFACDICGATMDCGADNHTWDEGARLPTSNGGDEVLYTCTACGKTKTEKVNDETFFAACYPSELTYQGKYYYTVQGVGVEDKVPLENVGDLLGYIIREEDVDAFTQEYPNVNYIIDPSIYDYSTNNRVAFYKVKGYDDLSLICVHEDGVYQLFEEIQNVYKVTIVDKYNGFIDKPNREYFVPGMVITIHCYPIMDADLAMYINGERIGIQNYVKTNDGDYIWEYSFTVPEEDIVVTFKTEGGM